MTVRVRRIRPLLRCFIEGCRESIWSRGMCRSHYWSWYKHGDPLVKKKRANGSGSVTPQGYHCVTIAGERRLVHVLAAEAALGKRLPRGVVVHHVDEEKENNRNTNLVVCPDQSYHRLLHARSRALAECGNADWRRCHYCKTYDSMERLDVHKNGRKLRYAHRACHNAHQREAWHRHRMEKHGHC